MRPTIPRILLGVLLWGVLLALGTPAGATEEILFGPKLYSRTQGWTTQYRDTIVAPQTLAAPFRLHLETGDNHGSERVLLVEVRLNGHLVAGLLDFLCEGPHFDRPVALQARNTLQVTLASRPGSWVRLTLYGTVPPPTLISLGPPTLPITQGGSGTLTATISQGQATPTPISLQSSAPSIAGVPATVTVPAGALAVAVPVAGVAPGTATITASLNGSSLQSTVTVAPAGPTITSLDPGTLPITQGAAGSLTVNLSAAQASDTLVALASSSAAVVGLPPTGSVTVPAGQTSQTFAVFGNSVGTATITASLNGSAAESRVTVVQPLPTLVSLLPPILPLTEGSRGTLTVTLNASQSTDTEVRLTAEPPDRVGLPGDRVTVPAGSIATSFPAQGLTRGAASVTAALIGSQATSAIEILPPPPTVGSVTCPPSLTLGVTGRCTVSLNATQLTATVVSLTAADPGVLAVPASITVPADTLSAQCPITGASLGSSTLTAGPLNGTSRTATVQVLPPPPILGGLTPTTPEVGVGATLSLTLTLTAALLEDTSVPLAWSPTALLSGPAQVTVPAGAFTVSVSLQGVSSGTALVTAGPLNGSTAESRVTVTQRPPTLTSLTPGTLTLPKGKPGTLTVTIAPTQSDPTGVPLGSSDPGTVEIPGSITVPAGAATAEFPVLSQREGQATITAGLLNKSTQNATITVTPAALLTLTVSPPAPSTPLGEAEPFTATGSYTDGSTPDLTTTATWTSSDESIATITGGIATGHKEGEVTITATVEGVTGTASLTVTPPVLAHLAVSPLSPTSPVGQSVQFKATGTLTDGNTQDLTTTVTWASTDATVASISPLGLATSLAPGKTMITATHEGITESTSLTVTLLPPTLTKFEPTSGTVGTSVRLTGSNFVTAAAVTFNGVAASSVTVTSSTGLTAVVPAGASSGPLAVRTSGGTATSAGSFVVLPTQDVSLVVEPGTVTTITGTSVSLKVTAVAGGSFSGLTALSVGPLPAGVTASFSPVALGPNASGLLTLTATGDVPASIPVEIRGATTLQGSPLTRTAAATLLVQAPGQTLLAGQIRDEDDQPLPGVSLRWGGNPGAVLGATDAGGNFQIPLTLAGPQVFLIDGSSAGGTPLRYPTIPVTVNLQPGVINGLGYLPRLHRQPPTQPLPVAPTGDTLLTFANLPDFVLTIPAGVSIIGWDGQANTQIGVRTVPLDRLAVSAPPPGVRTDSVYMFSFNKVGGGVPTRPIPVTVPNSIAAYPGQQVELWYYNEAPDGSAPNAWEQFGAGTVSSDGRLIVSNPGVGIPRFCCGAFLARSPAPPAGAPSAEHAKEPSPEGCPTCGGPIDLGSGLLRVDATDLTLAGRLPLRLTRTYRSLDPTVGPFGVGWRHSYEYFVRAVSPDLALLVTPENLRPRFTKQADGGFRNTDYPRFRGAVFTRAGDGSWSLRFKDGTTWSFNSSGWLIREADRDGNTLQVARDSQNRVSSISDPAKRSLTFSYTGTGLTVQQVTDPVGRTVSYTYDGQDRLALVTDPLGGVTHYDYDAGGRLASITDPRGIVTERITYDGAGRAIQQVQADGGSFQVAYLETAGTITGVTETDPNGNTLSYRFGPGRLLTEATDALGQRTQTPRSPGSNLVASRTDGLGRTTRYTYDALGNVTSITDPLNQTRTFSYDPTFNLPLTSTDPLGQTTRYAYDATGNLTAITDPLGHTTTFTYNPFGQPLTATDALGNVTTSEYDSVGNPIATVDPLGNRTERTYDALSRLLAVKDPQGALTRFAYDALDRLVGTTDPLGGTTALTYDANRNLLGVTDAKGQTTSHTYDAMNRLATRTDAMGRTERFSYDLNGNLTTVTDRKGQSTSHSYDGTNRRSRTEFADGSFVTFVYDPTGNLLTATDSGTGTLSYAYDPLNRITAEQAGAFAVTYAYDALGRRTAMQAGGLQPVAYGYDANRHLTQITQGTQAVSLSYDAVDRRASLVLPNGIAVAYQYDEASRLVGQAYTGPSGVLGDLTYSYDANGNRIGTGGSWGRSGVPGTIATSAYDAANQQLAFGAVTQTFDANGNLLTQTDGSGATTYSWDSRNRLVGLNGPTGSASFAYDALGRRITKTINGESTSYSYDGLDAIRETGPGGEASYLRTLAIDEALTRTDAAGAGIYLADILGSTVALSDSAGAPAIEYTYEPFGSTTVSGSSSSNPFQFTGRENDGTGLYYYRARYYDPVRSRFISQDPLGLLGGDLNVFAYVLDSPLMFVDPLGLCPPGTHPATPAETAGILAAANGMVGTESPYAEVKCNQSLRLPKRGAAGTAPSPPWFPLGQTTRLTYNRVGGPHW